MSSVVIATGVRPKGGVILHDFHACLPKYGAIFQSHFARALRVENRVYMHAGLGAFGQRLGEFASNFSVPKHVGLEVDRMFGRANGA